MRRRSAAQPGQSLVVVALFAILVFLAMGLTIDGGLIYVQRRLMQNTADAACLAAANQIAIDTTNVPATRESAARSSAQTIIAQNLGASGPGTSANTAGTLSYTNIADVYDPISGTGTSLARGIEINGADVRVALQSPATTFFMRVIGIGQYTVAARAHCDATSGGGASPFAVVRFRAYSSDSTDPNKIVKSGADTNVAIAGSSIVRDILRTESQSRITEWPGWTQSDYPGTPSTQTGLYSSPDTGVRAGTGTSPENAPGPEVPIAGTSADTNVPSNTSFSGPVILDYRQTTFPDPLFYNGLQPTTSLNQYKDLVGRYILGVYPGPYVIPGQQIAYYSGVSAGQVEKPFNLKYNVNDEIIVLVFNGQIYNSTQGFTLGHSPNDDSNWRNRPRVTYNPSCTETGYESDRYDGTGTGDGSTRIDPAQYTIQLRPDVFSNYHLNGLLSTDASSWGKLQISLNGSSFTDLNVSENGPGISVSPSGQNIAIRVQPSDTFKCTTVSGTGTEAVTTTVDLPMRQNGAQTVFLEARADATGYRSAVYALLNQDADNSDFYAYFPGKLVFLPNEADDKDRSVQFELLRADNTTNPINGTRFGVNSSGVSVGTIQWFAPGNLNTPLASGTSYAGVTLSITNKGNGPNPKNTLTYNVAATATTGREYYIRIPITSNGFTHYLWYYISVSPLINNSQSIKEYVYALGYARFRITKISSNEIYGRAISGLLQPDEITSGLQPRLQAWDTSTP